MQLPRRSRWSSPRVSRTAACCPTTGGMVVARRSWMPEPSWGTTCPPEGPHSIDAAAPERRAGTEGPAGGLQPLMRDAGTCSGPQRRPRRGTDRGGARVAPVPPVWLSSLTEGALILGEVAERTSTLEVACDICD